MTFTVGDAARLRSIEARATETGIAADARNGMLVLADPSGIRVALALQSEPGPDIRRQTEPAHTLEGVQPVP